MFMKITRIFLASLLLAFATGGCADSHAMDGEGPAQRDYLPAYQALQDDSERAHKLEVAYFAAGCFWGVQDAFNKIPGVTSTLVGYCGGKTKSPTYTAVCAHDTGHAETVRVVYDPAKISYERLVESFLELHDPTTLNRQGPDLGDQYRSAIFYRNDEQKKAAQTVIDNETRKRGSGYHIVTALEKFSVFYSAEDYHQNYLARTGRASCRVH